MAIGTVALIAAALISAMASTVGSVAVADKNAQSVKEANEANAKLNATNNAFNAQQAQIQRDYETEMANTAVQRKVADLKAAGLNPALAVATPASFTPGASAASNAAPVSMKATDYSPLAQISANLGHLVTSAARIQMLNSLSKSDPRTMAQLSNLSNSVSKGLTRAERADMFANVSDAEMKSMINDFYRQYGK